MPIDVYTVKLQDAFTASAKRIQRSALGVQKTVGGITGGVQRLASSLGGIGRGLANQAKALLGFGSAAQKAQKQAQGLGSVLAGFGKGRAAQAIQGLAGSFGELIPAIGGIGPAAAAAVAGIAAIGVAAFKVGSAISTLSNFRGELIGITGSGEAADRTLEAIRKTALETGNSFADTGKLFIQNLRLGFTEADSKFLVVLNDRLSDLNQSQPEAVAAAMTALQKSLTSGRFEAEAFTNLQKVGIDTGAILRDLAKSTGKSIADVKKGLSAGTISVAQFGAAFAKVTNDMPKAEKGISALFAELSGVLENQLIIPLAQKALPTVIEFTKSFIAGIREVADFVSKNGTQILTTLKGIGIVLGVVAAGFIAVNIAAIAAWAAAALPAVAVVAAIGLVGYAVGELIEHWSDVKDWAAGIYTAVLTFFSDLAARVTGFWESFSLVDVGRNIVLGLVNGISSAAGAALDAVRNLGAGLIDAAATQLGIKSPSTVFEYQGKMVDEGLALGIERHDDMVLKSAQDVTSMAIQESESAFRPVGGQMMDNTGTQAGMAAASGTSTGDTTITAPITISIDGTQSPEQTVNAVRKFFDEEFVTFLERYAQAGV